MYIKANKLLVLLIVLFSCSKRININGSYKNGKDKITIQNNDVVIKFGDTVYNFKLATYEANAKYIFLKPIEDTMSNLGLNIKKVDDVSRIDSTTIIFDNNISDCQCYCISYGKVMLKVIIEREMKIPKLNSFYIFTYIRYPLKKYRKSDEVIIEANTIYYISTSEKQFYPSYYYYLSWGLEPISKNKIRYLNKIYSKH